MVSVPSLVPAEKMGGDTGAQPPGRGWAQVPALGGWDKGYTPLFILPLSCLLSSPWLEIDCPRGLSLYNRTLFLRGLLLVL